MNGIEKTQDMLDEIVDKHRRETLHDNAQRLRAYTVDIVAAWAKETRPGMDRDEILATAKRFYAWIESGQ